MIGVAVGPRGGARGGEAQPLRLPACLARVRVRVRCRLTFPPSRYDSIGPPCGPVLGCSGACAPGEGCHRSNAHADCCWPRDELRWAAHMSRRFGAGQGQRAARSTHGGGAPCRHARRQAGAQVAVVDQPGLHLTVQQSTASSSSSHGPACKHRPPPPPRGAAAG